MTEPVTNTVSNEPIQPAEKERGTAEVRATRTPIPLGQALLFGAILLAVSIFYYVLPFSKPTDQQPSTAAVRQIVQFEPPREEAPKPVEKPATVMPVPVTTAPVPKPVDDELTKLLESAKRAPVLKWTKQGVGSQIGSTTASALGPQGLGVVAPPSAYPSLISSPSGANVNDLQAKMVPTKLEGVRAGYLGNRNFILAMGASVPCTLETAMSSDQPGFVSCRVTRDILSDNGRVVLFEKGTLIVGEYHGALKRGQSRLFVLWTRAKTPKGVIADLSSPATDALGRAGFDGDIDTHFFERFGAALLLSVVSDAVASAGNNSSGNGLQTNNTQSAGKDAASIAVEQSINIGPTLTKNQGELVNIFVARDVDFSNLYQLKVVETSSQIVDRAHSGDFERPAK